MGRRGKQIDHSTCSATIDHQTHSTSIEANSPNPYPPRGIYGFILFLFGWILFIAFFLWAFLPTSLLQRLYITYVPAKFWAVLGPGLIPLLITCFVVFHCVWNAWKFRGFFENVAVVENDFVE